MSLWNKMKVFVDNATNLKTFSDEELLKEIQDKAILIDSLLDRSKGKYVDRVELNKAEQVLKPLYENAKAKTGLASLFKREVRSTCNKYVQVYEKSMQAIAYNNEQIVQKNMERAVLEVLPVEGKNLDEQQLKAIAKDETNHLILAGAGTGKTTTIVGFIKYLTKCENIDPKNILVLSYTNASAAEMAERIEKEIGCKFDASTFHKLGMNIITAVEKRKPTIYSDNFNQFVKDTIGKLATEDKTYFAKMCSYLVFYSNDKSEFEFTNDDEYREYLRANPPTTLKGETVKSYGEMQIANFLLVNGINYEYESMYKFDTATEEYSQYKPDFYLPDDDLYIEYFGVDRNGNVASYFKDRNGMSASEAYNEGMMWKRKTHKENHTKMIECFAYEHFENILLGNLKKHLVENKVNFSPLSFDEIWNMTGKDNTDRLVELFCTIINLMKNNAIGFEELRERNGTLERPLRLDIIIDIVKPIYETYEKMLQETRQIDFNDMINKAAAYISEGKYKHDYKYVIVDEYQDIAQSRYRLLYDMRNQKDYKLFCVGDDWQSIYRFSGSDIGFILNFEKYWGPTEVDRIETTYRFSQSLIDLSGTFVMKNPHQIKKSLVSGNDSDFGFSAEEIQGYNEKLAIQFMENKVAELPKGASVLFLGRYNFDVKTLEGSHFRYQYSNVDNKIHVSLYKRQDLNITYMTAHGSKGLQADYVFILNNKNKGMGFPSKISDAPILQLLLDDSDNYPFSEERRLFYVAMTRAKKKAYFVTVKGNESAFISEIKGSFGKEMKNEQYRCPNCGGRLIRKSGPYGEFFGCENYSTTGCKYIRKIQKVNKS